MNFTLREQIFNYQGRDVIELCLGKSEEEKRMYVYGSLPNWILNAYEFDYDEFLGSGTPDQERVYKAMKNHCEFLFKTQNIARYFFEKDLLDKHGRLIKEKYAEYKHQLIQFDLQKPEFISCKDNLAVRVFAKQILIRGLEINSGVNLKPIRRIEFETYLKSQDQVNLYVEDFKLFDFVQAISCCELPGFVAATINNVPQLVFFNHSSSIDWKDPSNGGELKSYRE